MTNRSAAYLRIGVDDVVRGVLLQRAVVAREELVSRVQPVARAGADAEEEQVPAVHRVLEADREQAAIRAERRILRLRSDINNENRSS